MITTPISNLNDGTTVQCGIEISASSSECRFASAPRCLSDSISFAAIPHAAFGSLAASSPKRSSAHAAISSRKYAMFSGVGRLRGANMEFVRANV